jgi:ribosomal protein L28
VHVDIRINHLITKAPLYNKNKIKERINQYKKEEFEVLISKKKKKTRRIQEPNNSKTQFLFFFFSCLKMNK